MTSILPETHAFAGLRRHGYRCIVADPPWGFAAGTKGRPQHYARMTDAGIMRLPVDDLADPEGCFLFIWGTSPKVHAALDAGEAWGFRYSARAFVWVKTHRAAGRDGSNGLFFFRDGLHTGQGYTTRKNAEDCWLFKIGSPARLAKDVREIIISPLREHSRKPEEAYESIERFCAGPYLELFSRTSRPGWDCWGDQAGSLIVVRHEQC